VLAGTFHTNCSESSSADSLARLVGAPGKVAARIAIAEERSPSPTSL